MNEGAKVAEVGVSFFELDLWCLVPLPGVMSVAPAELLDCDRPCDLGVVRAAGCGDENRADFGLLELCGVEDVDGDSPRTKGLLRRCAELCGLSDMLSSQLGHQ